MLAPNIDLDILSEIYEDYENKVNDLNSFSLTIIDILRKCESVHTVKYRIKDPEHLIEKIIRKKMKDKDRIIDLNNYLEQITDLIGFRVIHLFKDEWQAIHKFIKEKWNLREKPKAYIRDGDSQKSQELYKELDCTIQKHDFGYRSVHYLIQTQPQMYQVICEIQVRTIFEEGWSEIDHKLRYPSLGDDELIVNYLEIFNRLAGSADEMGTYIKNLDESIKQYKSLLQEEIKEKEEIHSQLENVIQNLRISEEERNNLREKIDNLEIKEKISFSCLSNITTPLFGSPNDLGTLKSDDVIFLKNRFKLDTKDFSIPSEIPHA